MNPADTLPDFGPALPEIILAAGALILVLVGAFRGERSSGHVATGALALLVVALLAMLLLPAEPTITFGGSFIVDGFARFMKVLTLLASASAIVLSIDYLRREGIDRFEYPILIVLSTIGMLMLISANDLIALYLGLELLSAFLLRHRAFDRDNLRSTEAGLKYFVLGALSSGMLLYGASLVYGFTGTVSFPAIAAAAPGRCRPRRDPRPRLRAAGIAFKISAVPFHMWTPDVYEGSPTPVTAFFAAAPKMAAMAMAVRVFVGAFPGILGQWQQIIVFIAIASMALGSFAAIGQRNIKRLMAYSSIGQCRLRARRASPPDTVQGVQGVAIYMAIYLAMTLGAFACILAMRRAEPDVRERRGSLRPRAHAPGDRLLLRGHAVLAGRHPAARRLLRQVLRLRRRHRGGALRPRRDRRRHQRDRRLLLHPHRQGHVFRRAASAPSSRCRLNLKLVLAPTTALVLLFFLSRHPVMDRRRGRRRRPVAVLTCVSRPKLTPPAIGSFACDATQSTNDDAARCGAATAIAGRLWIVAGEQRAGRGRHGRPWVSPRGNLYASLLLVDPCEPAVAPQLGFVAGLALHEAVAAETGLAAPRLALKWPNDLLLDGAKTRRPPARRTSGSRRRASRW